MLFNSFTFLVFLFVVFTLYWFVFNKNRRYQNLLLLVSSYYFYACWDWRFLFLLMFSTFLDYFTGLKMHDAKDEASKKFWFWLSVIVNLGFLGIFKYYNFFAESFAEAASNLGITVHPTTLSIILPVGISFYTFHGLSYVIDIYKGRIPAERNFVDYAVFVCFFPLLVAGPIERATHLLPQVKVARRFDYSQAVDGLRLILWGFFKKIVIADNCAIYVNNVFANYETASGLELVLGAVFFALQIYGDFSGYSDIAIGVSKLMGFELLVNFRTPYFSRDIAEFWRRWHISLSTWFRDYLYFPLGGSKAPTWIVVRNTMIVFLVSGFWHGANWTFIVWGGLNAIYFLPLLLMKRNRSNLDTVAAGKMLPNFRELWQMGLTFSLTCLAWIFLRSENVTAAFEYISRIFSSNFLRFTLPLPNKFMMITLFVFVAIEWCIREKGINGFAREIRFSVVRYSFYFALICLLGLFGSFKETQFIYFQF